METQRRIKVNLAIVATLSLLLVALAACSSYSMNSADTTSAAKENQPANTSAVEQALPAAVITPRDEQVLSNGLSPCDPAPNQNYTPQQVAQRLASCHGATVMLARQVTLEDVANLGLGCYNFSSIETPPLVLVILKGDFGTGNRLGYTAPNNQSRSKYIAFVYDMWAGTSAIVVTSPNGGQFRKALNDPSLPDDAPVGSPTPLPVACTPNTVGKHLHYGETATGIIFPTLTPAK